MKRSIGSSRAVKKSRIRRRWTKIAREIGVALSVMTAATVFALIMMYGYNVALCSDFFTLAEAAVKGTDRLSDREVIQLLGVDDSTNILTADLNKMVAGVKTNPWVRDVRMTRDLPNRLIVEIIERKPVALISHDHNIYLLDREGTIFKNLDHDDKIDLPVMTGFSDQGVLDEKLLQGAFELLDCLAGRKGYPEMRHISEVRGDHLYGYSLCTMDRRFYLLGFGDFETKLRRLENVLFDLTTKNVSLSPLFVDMVDPERIIVRHGGAVGTGVSDGRKRTDI
ncbi:MAG: hypothetical protein AVO39_00090 [delta proteobacterium MLS_D]|jgi:cell division protein FtsQ|nr:MAG: hypothetical protein AVO39_00090 [delta proteobacterium MLS_D]